MKGLNIKRIAAIGLGAALVGSALAPAVTAATYNNVDTNLMKAHIVNDTGTPVVDIVVGSLGQAPDVVWAGNIAAKVAQLAAVPSGGAGTPTEKNVDFSVGGTQSTTGSGNTDENTVSFTSGWSEFNPIKADYSDSKNFVSISGRTIKNAGVESQINIDENVQAVMDVKFQSIADGVYPGEDVAEVAANGIVYSLNLGNGIPYYTNLTQLDSNTQYKVKVPILGKEYYVDEATSTKLVLYADTTPTDIEVGQSLTVDGVKAYAGKKLTITLVDLTSAGSGNQTYKAKWSLKDSNTGAVLKYVEKTPTYDLKDEFGTDYFETSVYVSSAGQSVTLNKYTATVRTGSSRIEIRNNEVFPYTSGVTNPQWKAYLTTGAGVNGSDGTIKYIQIKNNWSYLQNKTEQTNSKFVLKAGNSVMLPSDYAKVSFVGRQTKPMAKAVLGGDSVQITDTKGILRTIPLVISLSQGTNTFTIDGKTFLVDVNATDGTSGGVNGAIRYWTKPLSTITGSAWDSGATGVDGTDRFDVGYTTKDVNTNTAVGFTVDSDWKTGTVKYYIGGDETTSQYWLFLAAQQFDLDSKSDTVTTEISFAGSEVDQNASNGLPKYGQMVDLNYYLPDIATYNVLTTEAANVTGVALGTSTDGNVGTAVWGGTVQKGMFRAPTEGDNYQYVSLWKFNEGSTATSATTDVNFWVNNSTHTLVNSADNKTRLAAADNEVEYATWSLNEYSTAAASKLLKGITDFGSTVEVASGVATLLMPEEARKVEGYVGSNDTVTTTIGGESFKGVKAGETKTTTGGTKVTIDAVNGGAVPGSGMTIVKVPKTLVKLDTDTAYGKSIIVGGQLVNNMAKNLRVDGTQTLEDMLTADGDYVAAVLADGKIVVAGWRASDTGTAATILINKLEGFM